MKEITENFGIDECKKIKVRIFVKFLKKKPAVLEVFLHGGIWYKEIDAFSTTDLCTSCPYTNYRMESVNSHSWLTVVKYEQVFLILNLCQTGRHTTSRSRF